MKNNKSIYIVVAALLSLIAFVSLYYLTQQHWGLKLGNVGEQSLCNISQTLNCDAVSASKFASLFGVPIALWGAISFVAYLIFLCFGLLANSEVLLRHQYYLSFLFVLASIAMGIISIVFLNTYCLFCIAVYACSFLVFFCARKIVLGKPSISLFLSDLKDLAGKSKAFLLIYLAIPVLSFAIQDASIGNALRQVEEVKEVALEEWNAAKENKFESPPAIVMGAKDEDAKVVITEFADFLCPHCRFAAPSLKAFVYSKKDVQLRFYNFPLAGDCNDAITQAQPLRCHLAMLVQCGEELKSSGASIMAKFFAEQGNLNTSSALDLATEISGASKEELQACIEKPETRETVRLQAKEGEKAGIKGTPAIFINGKEARYGARLPILEIIYSNF